MTAASPSHDGGLSLHGFQIEHDGEHLLVGGLGADLEHHLLEKAAQLAQGIRLRLVDAGIELVGEGGTQLLPQGDEQLFFILEVPVDGAPGEVRRLGDIGQAGACQPLLAEEIQGRAHDVAAGLLRLFFGASGH